MKNPILFLSCLFCILLSSTLTSINAQSDSGKIIYKVPEATAPELKSQNGVTFQTDEILARIVSDNENSPFHEATGVCRNWVVAKGEGDTFAHGVCIMADKEGDTFIGYQTLNSEDKTITLHATGGTGKFKTLDGKGIVSEVGPAHTKKEGDCCMQTFEIKYKMK